MKVLTILFLIVSLFVLFGCSTNENDPLGSEPLGEPMKLTVTSDQIYYINLAKKAVVEVTDPLLDVGWDLSLDNLTR
ncbi:MAG: hypothetical protein V3U02_01740, partial [Calditrichia bacterium]